MSGFDQCADPGRNPEALARIHAAALAGPGWPEAEFAALLKLPRTILVTRPGAFALGQDLSGEAELLMLATSPERRRQGQARACLSDYESHATTRGATRFLLEVAADNDAALQLYCAAGYREDGRRKAYYPRKTGPKCDAILMSKPLSGAKSG